MNNQNQIYRPEILYLALDLMTRDNSPSFVSYLSYNEIPEWELRVLELKSIFSNVNNKEIAEMMQALDRKITKSYRLHEQNKLLNNIQFRSFGCTPNSELYDY